MLSESWKCLCCPPMFKPPRRGVIVPLEHPLPEPQIQTQSPPPPPQLLLPVKPKRKKSDLTLAAVVIIQTWFRRRRALYEIRRKTAWTIYQNIEYAGEQDQLKLYNFFLELMQAVTKNPHDAQVVAKVLRRNSSLTGLPEDLELEHLTTPEVINVESTYRGPHIHTPIHKGHFEALIIAFQRGEILHAHYILLILHELRNRLKRLPNINIVATHQTKCVTVIGDLHGSLADLMVIFHKNGLPSNENPYLFNGDIVDRGFQSIEVFLLISVAFIVYPNNVYLNRGNHEDHVLNLRYGFMKEIIYKYKMHATRILRLMENIYSWLPIASLIDDHIFVTHGGISDITDLKIINQIKRQKYVSVLSPSFIIPSDENQFQISSIPNDVLLEWRQVLDLLWSDPKQTDGCEPNTYRGGGCYWGPDVTQKILEKHNWSLLIRSHECKEEGFDYTHDKKVLTIFSASNYYAVGSNRGAYVKIMTNQPPIVVQFMSTRSSHKTLTLWERVSYVEDQAIQNLTEKFSANKSRLMKEFQLVDQENTGHISVNDWCDIVTRVLDLQLPWRTLKSRLVDTNENGLIIYESTFRTKELQFTSAVSTNSRRESLCQAIYRNKDLLETVFRAIDKDNSGVISMQEFTEVCTFLGKHNGSKLDEKQIMDLAASIDLNKNGVIDFNEFLEAFRIVDIGILLGDYLFFAQTIYTSNTPGFSIVRTINELECKCLCSTNKQCLAIAYRTSDSTCSLYASDPCDVRNWKTNSYMNFYINIKRLKYRLFEKPEQNQPLERLTLSSLCDTTNRFNADNRWLFAMKISGQSKVNFLGLNFDNAPNQVAPSPWYTTPIENIWNSILMHQWVSRQYFPKYFGFALIYEGTVREFVYFRLHKTTIQNFFNKQHTPVTFCWNLKPSKAHLHHTLDHQSSLSRIFSISINGNISHTIPCDQHETFMYISPFGKMDQCSSNANSRQNIEIMFSDQCHPLPYSKLLRADALIGLISGDTTTDT
ncbi:hypothetical protein I4U23_019267 [Adineta vaga]|nr:hypothetical protein I4U23_019267 [Adineta vaga]